MPLPLTLLAILAVAVVAAAAGLEFLLRDLPRDHDEDPLP